MSRWMRSLIGSHAGQIREFPDHVAEELECSGQAESVTEDEVKEYKSWLEGEEEAILPADETPEKPAPAKKAPAKKKTAAKKAPAKD